MRCDAWVSIAVIQAANQQLPIAAAFWIIQIVPVEECSSWMQNLGQIRCSTRSVVLNTTTTQYTRSLNNVYYPHWLVRWSHLCSRMHIPAHSPWLPRCFDIVQTVLIISTMAGLFPDRPLDWFKRWHAVNIEHLRLGNVLSVIMIPLILWGQITPWELVKVFLKGNGCSPAIHYGPGVNEQASFWERDRPPPLQMWEAGKMKHQRGLDIWQCQICTRFSLLEPHRSKTGNQSLNFDYNSPKPTSFCSTYSGFGC